MKWLRCKVSKNIVVVSNPKKKPYTWKSHGLWWILNSQLKPLAYKETPKVFESKNKPKSMSTNPLQLLCCMFLSRTQAIATITTYLRNPIKMRLEKVDIDNHVSIKKTCAYLNSWKVGPKTFFFF